MSMSKGDEKSGGGVVSSEEELLEDKLLLVADSITEFEDDVFDGAGVSSGFMETRIEAASRSWTC